MWQWVKASKAVALIAFFLPWMTVSCSSTELMRASGWNLALGKPRLSPQFAELAGSSATGANGHISLWLLAALAAIVIGLIVAFRPVRLGAPIVFLTSIFAAIVSWVGTARLTDEAMARVGARRGGTGGLEMLGAMRVHVEWQTGYWVFLLALIVSAVLAALSLGRHRR